MGKYLEETKKSMYAFLKKRIHLLKHPEGLLSWARENEKRARSLKKLRDDDEALRKYLVVNEPQMKFLQLWRMTQIKIMRETPNSPRGGGFTAQSSRGLRSHRKRSGLRSKLKEPSKSPGLKPLSEALLTEPKKFTVDALKNRKVYADD